MFEKFGQFREVEKELVAADDGVDEVRTTGVLVLNEVVEDVQHQHHICRVMVGLV